MILRFIPGDYNLYLAARYLKKKYLYNNFKKHLKILYRVILCIDLVLWYLKSLSFYTVIRKIGPKLVMINKMVKKLS
jgi:hypothetical protein